MSKHPKLRNLDIRPISQQGRPFILLRDPLQFTDKQLLLPQPLASALAYCDGRHRLDEIEHRYAERHGFLLNRTHFQEMLTALDEACMLENERSHAAMLRARDAYRNAPSRIPYLAGPSYPDDPKMLRDYLERYMAAIPASQPGRKADAEPKSMTRGLLSPHIDYQRGGPVYAQIWSCVTEAAQAADLVVMFGTDHYGADLFTLTRQHYATPYGILPTPFPTVDALAQELGEEAAYAGELRHRGEHSLELVAVWLHHIRGGRPCELVPILVGGFHPFLYNGEQPESHEHVQKVLSILYEQCQGKNVLVVASGDMAHVGPAFGGEPLSNADRKRLRQQDDALLNRMKQGDAAGFFDEIRAVNDRNNVCGVSPIYLTMRLLEMLGGPMAGEQIGYDVCPADEANSSVVTIGGVRFF